MILFSLLYIYKIYNYSCKIDWENQKINDIGNDCLMSVDGTDFLLAYRSNDGNLYCYKFKGPELRYEVSVCLWTSNIVWISGPHFSGLYNDLQIFHMELINMLEEHIRVRADDGYNGKYQWKCKFPWGISRKGDRTRMNQRQQNRHETVNKQFKNWGYMKKKFHHSFAKHCGCFQCIAILSQLAIKYGEELFTIDYDNRLCNCDVGLN